MILPREGSFLIFVSLDDVLNVNWWTAFSRRGCDPVAWKLVEQFFNEHLGRFGVSFSDGSPALA